MSTEILKALDDSNLTTHQKVEAIFAGSEALLQAALPVRNVIMQLGSHRTDLEDALVDLCWHRRKRQSRLCPVPSHAKQGEPRELRFDIRITFANNRD